MADKPSRQSSPLPSSDGEYSFDYNDGPYRCSDCGTSYNERNRFNEHLVAYHPRATVRYLCPDCGVEHGDFESLRRHTVERHPSRSPELCTLCQCWLKSLKAMEYHKERHRERKLRRTCRRCSLVFDTRHRLRLHWKMGHAREYECSVCGNKFFRKNQPPKQEALRKDGKTRRWVPVCQRCGKIFTNLLQLDRHTCANVSDNEASHPKCCDCGKKIDGKEDILGQKKTEKDEQPHKCEGCTEKLSKQENHKRPKRDHENRDYICEKCRKNCGSPGRLSKHRKTCGEPVAGPSHAPY